jgi:hypothetical protein
MDGITTDVEAFHPLAIIISPSSSLWTISTSPKCLS